MTSDELQDDEAPTTRRVSVSDEPGWSMPGIAPPPTDIEAPFSGVWFSVSFEYVEPGYAASVASSPKNYTARFSVLARSPDAAVHAARARFAAIARDSLVGWQRVITSVACARCSDADARPDFTIVAPGRG